VSGQVGREWTKGVNTTWPRCPYCGYKWTHELEVRFLVIRPDEALETVAQCPCGKYGILMHFTLKDARPLDIEGAKHYGVPEGTVRKRTRRR